MTVDTKSQEVRLELDKLKEIFTKALKGVLLAILTAPLLLLLLLLISDLVYSAS